MAAAEPIRPVPPQTVELPHGRTLTLVPGAKDDLVEIRGAEGLEVRIRLTPEGPVLEVDSLRMSLKASEGIDVECGEFTVSAENDVRLEGKTIYLN